MSARAVERAEAAVERDKAVVAAQLDLLSERAHRTASSPWVIASACVAAFVLAYAVSRRSRRHEREPKAAAGGWTIALQAAQILAPLMSFAGAALQRTARGFGKDQQGTRAS